MELVPGAVTMRTHSLVQSTPLLAEVLAHTPVRIDLSLLLAATPLDAPVEFTWDGRSLKRLVTCWEDDFAWQSGTALPPAEAMLDKAGLKVFDFHPVHIALNSVTADGYTQLKEHTVELPQVGRELMDRFTQKGNGTRTAFLAVIDRASAEGRARLVREVVS
ncbi:MAG TPA: hypothetical protein VIL77_04035 [Gaiellaceae bacterium]